MPTGWQREVTFYIQRGSTPVTITWLPGATQIILGFSVDTGSHRGRGEKTAAARRNTSLGSDGSSVPQEVCWIKAVQGEPQPRCNMALRPVGSLPPRRWHE